MRFGQVLLVAIVAGGGAGPATTADPSFPATGLFAVEPWTGRADGSDGRPPRPEAVAPADHRPTDAWSSRRPRTSLEADGFYGAIFEPADARDGSNRTGPIFERVFDPIRPAQAIGVADPVGGSPDAFATGSAEELVYGPPRSAPWRFWVAAEVLYGTGRAVDVPPLITTGPVAQGPFVAGALGVPGTTPLFGGRSLLGSWRTGLRAELGLWFDRQHLWGGFGRFYSLFTTSERFVGSGIGVNVLNLPQFVLLDGLSFQFPIYAGFPGLTTGSATAFTRSTFTGGDLNVRRLIRQGETWRLDAMVGYRQLYLADRLGASFLVVGPQLLSLTPVLTGSDDVRTRNHFYGPQLGTIGSAVWRRWMIQGLGAVALGVNVTELDYERTRSITIGSGPPSSFDSISSSDRMTYFGVAAEGGIRLHYRLTDAARLTFGYSTISWWNLRRAQEQYRLSPVLADNMTHYTVHTLSWGVELRY